MDCKHVILTTLKLFTQSCQYRICLWNSAFIFES